MMWDQFQGNSQRDLLLLWGGSCFKDFKALIQIHNSIVISCRDTCGDAESNRINTVTLQCSYITINSPVKDWRATFLHSILNYIIRHTNKYVEDRCKDWSIRNCSDIITFICIIVFKVIFEIENRNPLIGSLIIHY